MIAAQVAEAPENAKEIKLKLTALVLEGNTVFSEEVLRQHYRQYIGQEMTLYDVYGIAEKITAFYRNKGYVLSRAFVPVQTIDGGVVRIRIIEGSPSSVTIEGDITPSRMAKRIIKKIEAIQPLHMPTLERYILLLNELAGLEAYSVFQPVESAEEGEVSIAALAIVLRKASAVHSLRINNEGSRFLGPVQAAAATEILGLTGDHQRTRLTLFAVPDEQELRVFQLNHIIPLGAEGTKLSLSASYGDAEPGYRLAASQLETRTSTYGLEVNHPFVRSRRSNLSGFARFHWMDTRTTSAGALLTDDHVRAFRAGLSGNMQDPWQGSSAGSVTLSQGIGLPGVSDEGEAFLSRADAQPEFTKIEFTFVRSQQLPHRFSVVTKAAGQYSWDSLFSSEEFGAGGATFGRGYDNSEITGDHGIAAALELHYHPNQSWGDISTQPFIFFDFGTAWDVSAGDEDRTYSLSSWGMGMLMQHESGLSGSVYFADPLTRAVSASTRSQSGDPRLYFTMNYLF